MDIGSFAMALFCKKTFLPLPSSPLLDFTNALRPDSPSRKFRGQQNYSENSEGTEGTESTEETESTERTEATVSEPGSDRHSCLSPSSTGLQACAPFPPACTLRAGVSDCPACAPAES